MWLSSHVSATNLLFAALFAGAALFILSLDNPFGVPGGGHTDHAAHIGEARLFVKGAGLDLWRVPVSRDHPHATPADLANAPDDVRAAAASYPNDLYLLRGPVPLRPLYMNWGDMPRVYPPGVLLLAAPSAILYGYGLVSFAMSNKLFVILLVGAWLLVARLFLRQATEGVGAVLPVKFVATLTFTLFFGYWSVKGMYDVCAVLLLALGLRAAAKSYGLALLLYGAAAFVHTRAFLLAGPIAFAFFGLVSGWRGVSSETKLFGALGSVLLVLSLGSVALAAPGLTALPDSSVLHGRATLPFFLLGAGAVAALFAWRRSAFDLATFAMAVCAVAQVRELRPWHCCMLLPWVLGPIHRPSLLRGYRRAEFQVSPLVTDLSLEFGRIAAFCLFFAACNYSTFAEAARDLAL